VNAIGQRTGVATSGTAYPAVPSWLWSYDALGQVIAADSSVATSDRAYQYDAIGNRQKSSNSLTLPAANNYTANALNQYSTIQQGGTGVSPVYDFDGNATAYALPVSPTTISTLLWDGENRLTEVKNSTGTTIEKNVFDSGSRKIATTANGVTTLYLYDGWNCIAEYTRSVGVSPTLQKTRLWGTDLSGSMQGAGGVGGMLSESSLITSNPIMFNSSYPTYDGNGNVSEYLDSTGQVTAHFEYDPFGNTVVNTDTSNQFAYRFSTKPLAFATGLYYYGYRYYDPLTGRWPSRDPIEEMGGVNLYGFVGNDGVNKWDYLGQFSLSGLVGASGSGSYYFPLWGWGGVYVSGSVEIRTGTCTKDSGGTTTYDSISGSFGGGVYAGTPGMRWRIRANMVENLRCCPEPTDGKWEGSINGAVRIGFFVVQVNISGSGITTTGGIQGPERPLDFRGTLGGSVSYKKVRVY
jgi:RHS repeat-associated protein